jgi:hypothetical protein
MGKHVKESYVLCQDGICEGDNAITDYKYEVASYKEKLIQSLMYVDTLRGMVNPLGKAYGHINNFLMDDDLNKMIGVEEMLETQKKLVEHNNDRA